MNEDSRLTTIHPLASSFARLRTTIWGGALLTPSEALTMLERNADPPIDKTAPATVLQK
jgi:hypothetical protein